MYTYSAQLERKAKQRWIEAIKELERADPSLFVEFIMGMWDALDISVVISKESFKYECCDQDGYRYTYDVVKTDVKIGVSIGATDLAVGDDSELLGAWCPPPISNRTQKLALRGAWFGPKAKIGATGAAEAYVELLLSAPPDEAYPQFLVGGGVGVGLGLWEAKGKGRYALTDPEGPCGSRYADVGWSKSWVATEMAVFGFIGYDISNVKPCGRCEDMKPCTARKVK
jgi:hypothetical protein